MKKLPERSTIIIYKERLPLFVFWREKCMKALNKNNFGDEVLKEKDKRVMLFFYGENDDSSEVLASILLKMEEGFDQIKFCKINAEEEKMMAFNYQALEVPHLILMEKGEVIGSINGAGSEEDILTLIQVKKGL